MQTLHKILLFLEGKKAVILSIISVVLSYLVAGHIIDAQLGAMLQTIVSILTGGAVAAGTTQSYQDYKLGAGK